MGLLSTPQQKGRKASPDEQKQYTLLVKQILGFIAKPKVREQLKKSIETQGPEKGLAMIVAMSLGMVGKSAQKAGVQIAKPTGIAALKEIITVLASMLSASGIVKDVEATVKAVLDIILSGGKSAQQPMQQPMQQRQQQMRPNLQGA